MNDAEYEDLVVDCNEAGVSAAEVACLYGYVTYLYAFEACKPLRSDGTFPNVSPRDIDASDRPLILMYETISEMLD